MTVCVAVAFIPALRRYCSIFFPLLVLWPKKTATTTHKKETSYSTHNSQQQQNRLTVVRRSCVKKRQHDAISFVFVLIRIFDCEWVQERRQHIAFSVYLSLFEDEHYCLLCTSRTRKKAKKKENLSRNIHYYLLQTVFLTT